MAIGWGWFNLRLMANFSLLDEPTIREQAVRFTVEQYQLLGEAGLVGKNVELLEGILIKKMSKLPLHSAVTQRAADRLRAILGGKWKLRQEQPISHENSEPEPDIAIVPTREDDYAHKHPATAELVIEVAVSSVEIDQRKRVIYAAADVREYWIILPGEQRVEVHTRPLGREYRMKRVYVVPEVVVSEALPAFRLDLATFFPG